MSYEQGEPPTFEFTQKILTKIDEAYESMSRKYRMSLKAEEVIKSIEDHYLKLKETNPGMDEHWYWLIHGYNDINQLKKLRKKDLGQ